MKTRLPKMLLAALLAAMTYTYAEVAIESDGTANRYYSGDGVITDANKFGMGDSAGAAATVNIGWGDMTAAHDANVTLSGANFSTPNALFIGGPGWGHKESAGYKASTGTLTITNGATVKTGVVESSAAANHVTMGGSKSAVSNLIVQNGKVQSGALEASIGGGQANITVESAGLIEVGTLRLGTNNEGGNGVAHMNINGGSVNVAGESSIGYEDASVGKWGGVADVVINGGSLTTSALTIGVNDENHDAVSQGFVTVNGGSLVVEGGQVNIGFNGGEGSVSVDKGGVAKLGAGDVYLGGTEAPSDGSYAMLKVAQGTLVHTGNMYVGDIDGNANASLVLGDASNATLGYVEVSRNALIDLSGQVKAGTINLYDGARLAGNPNPYGGSVDINIIHEADEHDDYPPHIVITKDTLTGTAGFTLTSGTTVHAPVNTHLDVVEGATLAFGNGTMHLQEDILYIGSNGNTAGTITLASGSSVGYISLSGNTILHNWIGQMTPTNPEGRVALIDTSEFLDNGGKTGVFTTTASGQLVARDLSSLYVIKFTNEGLATLNEGSDFRGFYLELADRYPAEDAYDDLDRNEQVAFDTIKELDKDIENLPPDLQEIVHEVLNTPGDTQANELAKVLDALNGSTMAVMMHNQIEGNLAQQRRLRSRAYNGRNLRHDKGCTDIYAEAFYDNQHVDYRRSAGMGHNRNEWGGLIGGDTCIGKNWRVGADFAMSWSHVNPTGGMKFKQNSMYMDVYATVHKGNWRSITGIGMGLHNFDVKRGMNGNVWAKADDVKGTAINITEEVAYDYHYSDKTVLQPYVAIDMNINRIDEFTDTGLGSANLHCRRQSAFATDITIGGRYIHDFSLVRNAPDATWTAQLGVTVSVGDTTADLDLNFVGAPDKRFIITTPKRDVVGLNVGTGLTVPVSEHTAIYGGVQAIIRGDSHSFDANLGVRYAF